MSKRGRHEELPAWYREMEKDLECPVCLNNFIDPPIYVCENQHGLCMACHTKLNDEKQACPVCKGKLTDKRNLLVERMLDRLPKAECVFPECSFKRTDPQLVLDHQEDDCCHRKAPCGICGESVAMSSLNDHLTNMHREDEAFTLYESWTFDFRSVGQERIHSLEEPLNSVSFYFNQMLLNRNCTMMWVSYNGPKKDAQKYQFSIDLLNEQEEMVLSGTRFCVPCDTSRDVVKEKYLGIVIHKDLAKEVKEEKDGKIRNLRKIDIEVKLDLAPYLS